MYASVDKVYNPHSQPFEIFRDMKEARQWLGLDDGE
jgi:hypothetical protein